jgi:hypothetical protein
MSGTRRLRLSERDGMEGGVRCPECGSYTSFGDVLATGRCSGRRHDGCDVTLDLELRLARPRTGGERRRRTE